VAVDTVLFEVAEVAEVDLALLAGLGLEPDDGGDLLLPPQRPNESLDEVVAAGVPLGSDLLEETDRGEGVLGNPCKDSARWPA
jgi:hypothetical protein